MRAPLAALAFTVTRANDIPNSIKLSFFESAGNDKDPTFDTCDSQYLKSESYDLINVCNEHDCQDPDPTCIYATSNQYVWIENSTELYGGHAENLLYGDEKDGPNNADCSGDPIKTLKFSELGICTVSLSECEQMGGGCFGNCSNSMDTKGCCTYESGYQKYCYYSYLDEPQY